MLASHQLYLQDYNHTEYGDRFVVYARDGTQHCATLQTRWSGMGWASNDWGSPPRPPSKYATDAYSHHLTAVRSTSGMTSKSTMTPVTFCNVRPKCCSYYQPPISSQLTNFDLSVKHFSAGFYSNKIPISMSVCHLPAALCIVAKRCKIGPWCT